MSCSTVSPRNSRRWFEPRVRLLKPNKHQLHFAFFDKTMNIFESTLYSVHAPYLSPTFSSPFQPTVGAGGGGCYADIKKRGPVFNQIPSHITYTAGLRIRIHFIRIRIKHSGLNTSGSRSNTDPDPIRTQGFNDKK